MKDNINGKTTTNRGIKNWIGNCIRFYYQRIFGNRFCKRDTKLWAFGAWEGTKYSDNSRYLFEYVWTNAKDIKCIWFTKNESVYHKLKQNDIPVCMIGTNESKSLQKKVGVAFYTTGIDDFGTNPYVYGAKLVCLWHGIGIKKNYATRKMHEKNFVNILARYKAHIFSYIYRDLTISSSKFISLLYKKESLTKNPIYILGQPRNDVLINNVISVKETFDAEYIERFGLDDNTVFITYMPTYRGNNASQAFLENLISELISNKELNEFLKFTGIKFLIKMHYLTDISNMHFNENIMVLRDCDVECVQKLLCVSDMLITDYSTSAIDFAILQRPLLFFTPDINQYSIDNGLYDEFVNIIDKYKIEDINILVSTIRNYFYDRHIDLGVIEELNDLYNTNASKVGSYCEDVFEAICRFCGI